MSKHFSKTEFEYPVHRICGKISRKSKVIHSCTASGKYTTYLQGERNLVAHPVTQAELGRSLRTTQRYLGELKKEGKIRFEGVAKKGGYYVNR